MTDNRATPDTSSLPDDEFHSSLEIDDTRGWRVFLVPGIALLFLIGAILMVVLYQGDAQPDPRVVPRLEAQRAKAAQPAPAADPALKTAQEAPAAAQ